MNCPCSFSCGAKTGGEARVQVGPGTREVWGLLCDAAIEAQRILFACATMYLVFVVSQVLVRRCRRKRSFPQLPGAFLHCQESLLLLLVSSVLSGDDLYKCLSQQSLSLVSTNPFTYRTPSRTSSSQLARREAYRQYLSKQNQRESFPSARQSRNL